MAGSGRSRKLRTTCRLLTVSSRLATGSIGLQSLGGLSTLCIGESILCDDDDTFAGYMGMGATFTVSERRPTKAERDAMRRREPIGFVRFPIKTAQRRRKAR